MKYSFQWDPGKARSNQTKHRLGFRRATEVFRDPHAVSIYDEDHSSEEDRWVTLGTDQSGILLIVVHTFHRETPERTVIRLISARRATRRETRQYEEGT
jgi:uncharacterized DUF497 family protein